MPKNLATDFTPRTRRGLRPFLLSLTLMLALFLAACVPPTVVDPDVDDTAIDEAITDDTAIDEPVVDEPVSDEAVIDAQASTGPTDAIGVVDAPDQFVRASLLLDYDLQDATGENIGEIENLLIDLNDGSVILTEVEYGGLLDLGDRHIYLPMSAYTIGPDNNLVLTMDEAQLENHPDVDDNWWTVDEPDWNAELETYWSEVGIELPESPDRTMSNAVWADNLIGFPIIGMGTIVLNVNDLLINLQSGVARYALLGERDLGVIDDAYIVPTQALTVDVPDQQILFEGEITDDMLIDAPRFDATLYPTDAPIGPEFIDDVDAKWAEMGFDWFEGELSAMPTENEEVDEAEGEAEDAAAPADQTAGQYLRALLLLDYDLETTTGDDVGEIEDFLIDLNDGTVILAEVEYGGLLDLGDSHIYLPMNAFNTGPEDGLVLAMDEAMLEAYPNVEEDWWDFDNPDWSGDLETYWNDVGIAMPDVADRDMSNAIWVSDIVGIPLVGLGTALVTVNDLLINLEQGVADYALVGDTTAGALDEAYVVPVEALTFDPGTDQILLEGGITDDMLVDLPRFDTTLYPVGEPIGPAFTDQVNTAWDELGIDWTNNE